MPPGRDGPGGIVLQGYGTARPRPQPFPSRGYRATRPRRPGAGAPHGRMRPSRPTPRDSPGPAHCLAPCVLPRVVRAGPHPVWWLPRSPPWPVPAPLGRPSPLGGVRRRSAVSCVRPSSWASGVLRRARVFSPRLVGFPCVPASSCVRRAPRGRPVCSGDPRWSAAHLMGIRCSSAVPYVRRSLPGSGVDHRVPARKSSPPLSPREVFGGSRWGYSPGRGLQVPLLTAPMAGFVQSCRVCRAFVQLNNGNLGLFARIGSAWPILAAQ
ncbi:hypothetical protein SAMN05421541_102584 [Actinoplanes philippinensis]|uniref:Uncharacterized protein n=1 Tax=Actinoplanes philippinensis TaxID=35752 RepID=A0A1I2BZN9_9ACTN|nr:hypothetical protein SAMN05421541_102584 [Actinoplanes philippinensis]